MNEKTFAAVLAFIALLLLTLGLLANAANTPPLYNGGICVENCNDELDP